MASQSHTVRPLHSLQSLSYSAFLNSLEEPIESLKDLCLNFIVVNFERFYHAFTVSNDDEQNNVDLRRNFEFLQRRHSYDISAELFSEGTMKEEYFNFLINRHVKSFDVEWMEDVFFPASWEKIFCRLSSLISLNFSKHCNDDILEVIAKFCPMLVEIYLKHSHVTDNGIKHLCANRNGEIACPNLKRIFISFSRVTSRSTEYLVQNLPSLEWIDDRNLPLVLYSIHKNDLDNLESANKYKLIDLNTLKFRSLSYYVDLLRICLVLCPAVKYLTCQISHKEELYLITGKYIKRLHLEFVEQDTKINIDVLLREKGHDIIYLRIYNCEISLSALALACPMLKRFYASNVNLTNVNSRPPFFECLEKCTVEKIKSDRLTDNEISLILVSSPKLSSLSFRFCDMSFYMKKSILDWCEAPTTTKVKVIYLKGLAIERSFITNILLKCHSLHTLCLDVCSLDTRDIRELYRLTDEIQNLPVLSLNDRYINEYFSDSSDDTNPSE